MSFIIIPDCPQIKSYMHEYVYAYIHIYTHKYVYKTFIQGQSGIMIQEMI